MSNQHANETKQHALPAEEQARPPAEGQEPSGEKKKADVVLWTDGEVAERHGKLRQQISQLEKDAAGGKEKAEAAIKELETMRQQWRDLEQLRDAEEWERIKDDPTAVAQFHQRRNVAEGRRKVDADRATLTADQAKHAEDLKAVYGLRVLRAADEVAKEFGVEVAHILEWDPQTPEDVKFVAERLAKVKAGAGEGARDVLPKTPPESGISSGGIGWRELTAEEKIRHAMEHPTKK